MAKNFQDYLDYEKDQNIFQKGVRGSFSRFVVVREAECFLAYR